MSKQHGIKTTLTSWITVPVDDDAPPRRVVDLKNVPVLAPDSARAKVGDRLIDMPRRGMTFHYGSNGIREIVRQRVMEAIDAGENCYEVKARVDIGTRSPFAALTTDDIASSVPTDPLRCLNLTRANQAASDYLKELIAEEIAEVFEPEAASDLLIDEIVSHYPPLLDSLRESGALNDVALILWGARIPTFNSRGNPLPQPLFSDVRVATLYMPDLATIETIGSEFVTAKIPAYVGHLSIRSAARPRTSRKIAAPGA